MLAVPGPDIPVAPKRIQEYKAFLKQTLDSVRFALMKVNPGENLTPLPKSEWDLGDRWIASRFNRLAGEMSEYFHEYRFDLAANAVYQFLWHEFCDWYIEWIKPHLNDYWPRVKEKKGLLIGMISNVLSLLHPFVPFVSEYLWQQLPDMEGKSKTLARSPYPIADPNLIDEAAETEFAFLMELIGRSGRFVLK